jgi:hypothetical protein
MRTGANRRRLAALTGSGSQVGSQRAAAPGDARPHAATEAAGERHAGPRPATPGDGRSVHGMQVLISLVGTPRRRENPGLFPLSAGGAG